MSLFIGRYAYVLDDKNRVNIPAKFRAQLPKEKESRQLAIFNGLDPCLFAYPLAELDELTERFTREHFMSDKEARRFQRLMFSTGSIEKLDSQGRVMLGEKHREHAGLDRNVVIVGAMRRIEIWDPDKLEACLREDEAGTDLSDLASKFFSSISGSPRKEAS